MHWQSLVHLPKSRAYPSVCPLTFDFQVLALGFAFALRIGHLRFALALMQHGHAGGSRAVRLVASARRLVGKIACSSFPVCLSLAGDCHWLRTCAAGALQLSVPGLCCPARLSLLGSPLSEIRSSPDSHGTTPTNAAAYRFVEVYV